MLKKIIISIIAIIVCYVASSQDSTMEPIPQEKEEIKQESVLDLIHEEMLYDRVMIVPFESKLYRSEVDRDIYKKTGLAPSQIKNNFRLGITNILLGEVMSIRPAVSMLVDSSEIIMDLSYIHKSLGYHYQYLPVNEEKPEETKAKEVFNKIKSKTEDVIYGTKEAEEPGTRLKEGQIYSVPYTQERFMNSRAINPGMFEYLSNKYEVGYFVMINQLDIQIAPGTDYRALQNGMYRREIKVHYTIFDQRGKEIYASAAKNYFPSVMNDMNMIIKGHFPKIAKEIAFHVPKIELTEAQEEKKKLETQQATKQMKELDTTYGNDY